MKKKTTTKFEAMKSKLDKYRVRGKRSDAIVVTDEQRQFLILCRDHESPVTWAKTAELWEELGWGTKSHQQLKQRYDLMQKGLI